MKPLIRWIVGPVSEQGLEILELAISRFKMVYGHLDLDLCVCYNQIKFDVIAHLEKYGVTFYNQHKYNGIKIPPKGEMWKIYPPRLRKDAHELIIDNDLVIFEPVSEIAEFLEGKVPIILSGRGRRRYYGQFDGVVPEGVQLSTGMFGFHPGFDFNEIVQVMCELNPMNEWMQNRRLGLYDDQGLIAHAVTKDHEPIVVPQESIFNFNPKMKNIIPIEAKGAHFVGANVRRSWLHPVWQKFKEKNDWSSFKKIYNDRIIL